VTGIDSDVDDYYFSILSTVWLILPLKESVDVSIVVCSDDKMINDWYSINYWLGNANLFCVQWLTLSVYSILKLFSQWHSLSVVA
jgi:hypothetical protein